jgi:hypothetical protein
MSKTKINNETKTTLQPGARQERVEELRGRNRNKKEEEEEEEEDTVRKDREKSSTVQY